MLDGQPPLARTSSPKAIVSLVLGLATSFLWCLAGVPAIILGVLALLDIRRSKGRLRGKGAAEWGIGMAVFFGGVLLVVLFIAALWPAIRLSIDASERAQLAALVEPFKPFELPEGMQLTDRSLFSFDVIREDDGSYRTHRKPRDRLTYFERLPQPNEASTAPKVLITLVRGNATRSNEDLFELMRSETAELCLSEGKTFVVGGPTIEPRGISINLPAGGKEIEIMGQELTVLILPGAPRMNLNPGPYRRYVGQVPRGDTMMAVIVATIVPAEGDNSGGAAGISRGLTEDEVRAFFASCVAPQDK
jgi:hypothetical protein